MTHDQTPQSPARPPPKQEGANLIHLQDVSLAYQGANVLEGLTLEVRAGEFMSVLGRSGVGKTTLLRVIAGFEHVSAGYVRIGGRLVGSTFVHLPPDRRRVGVVFQDYALFPHLTVTDNVAFGLQELDRKDKEARVRSVLDMTGLGGLERRYPHELSGGQQQRVALARALAPRPVAVLLDEPFSNLDRELRATLRRDVREIIKSAGTTAVLVTHDREEALAMADRVAVMGPGKVEQTGTPEEVYWQPASPGVARLVGPCELLPGRVRGSQVETEAGTFPVSERSAAPDGVKVTALMRASELEVGPSDTGVDARIVYREFRGDFAEYGVGLPSGLVLRVRRRSAEGLPDGQRVWVRARPGSTVIVFTET